MKADELELPLRILVLAPPRDVLFCIQGKLGEFLSQTRSTGADLVFEFTLRAKRGVDAPRLLGSIAQGPPNQRFVYVCSGTCAGAAFSPVTRRAKVPLAGITNALVSQAANSGVLEARIAGRARDGGPACATVPLLDGGWRHTG